MSSRKNSKQTFELFHYNNKYVFLSFFLSFNSMKYVQCVHSQRIRIIRINVFISINKCQVHKMFERQNRCIWLSLLFNRCAFCYSLHTDEQIIYGYINKEMKEENTGRWSLNKRKANNEKIKNSCILYWHKKSTPYTIRIMKAEEEKKERK